MGTIGQRHALKLTCLVCILQIPHAFIRSVIQPSFIKEAWKCNFHTNTRRILRNTAFDTPYSVSHNESGSHDSCISLEATKKERNKLMTVFVRHLTNLKWPCAHNLRGQLNLVVDAEKISAWHYVKFSDDIPGFMNRATDQVSPAVAL